MMVWNPSIRKAVAALVLGCAGLCLPSAAFGQIPESPGKSRVTDSRASIMKEIESRVVRGEFAEARRVVADRLLARDHATNDAARSALLSIETAEMRLARDRMKEWCEVKEEAPNVSIVTSEGMRNRLKAYGLPWRVRDKKSGTILVLIPSGEFVRGAPPGSPDAEYFERPRAVILVSRCFYLGECEVSQGEWSRVMDKNPSRTVDPSCPIESVSINDIDRFLSATGLRLPYEYEWNYACAYGDDVGSRVDLGAIAWWGRNAGFKTHPCGTKRPNGFGLYDMIGNVEEWCADTWSEYPSGGATLIDPINCGSDAPRVVRGGSIGDGGPKLNSWKRGHRVASAGGPMTGFRVARSP